MIVDTVFIVRSATVADALAIASINIACWNHAYAAIIDPALLAARSVEQSASNWADALARPGNDVAVFVASVDRDIIGFGSSAAQRDECLVSQSYSGEITTLYVAPPSQRRGAGSRLLQELTRSLRGQGHDAAALWVLETNAPARLFYERHGLQPLGVSKTLSHLGNVTETAYGWRLRTPEGPCSDDLER